MKNLENDHYVIFFLSLSPNFALREGPNYRATCYVAFKNSDRKFIFWLEELRKEPMLDRQFGARECKGEKVPERDRLVLHMNSGKAQPEPSIMHSLERHN